MTLPALDERSGEVLKSLIQAHIATGEPVGSESLSRLLNRPLSPATIRNIMADLERLGLLDHPHTSAGRVPTDEGYRYYVDALMGKTPLAPREAAAIRSGLRAEGSSQEVIENACHLLSSLSRNVAFILAPDMARTSFRRIDFVRLPHPRVLVVIVAQAGLVTHKVIEVEDELTQDDLQACANYLNVEFAGMRLSEVRGRLLELMREEKALYDSLLKKVVSVGERAFADEGEGNVYLDGASNMLEKPEFDDLPRMRALFKTFEEKGRLVKILNACLSDEGLRILIGHENPEPELRDTSLVAASYPLDGESGWGVGVVGSTRMEYARVIALVDHVAREVTRALKEIRA
jgi:heat-inducible transcriptional repressor